MYFKVNTFKFLYSPSGPQTAQEASKIQFGGMMKHLKRMKTIGICTGAASHFEFSLTPAVGMTDFDLRFVGARSPSWWVPEARIVSVLQPVIRQFLSGAIVEAKERGGSPRLDSRKLVDLLVLVANERRPMGLIRSE